MFMLETLVVEASHYNDNETSLGHNRLLENSLKSNYYYNLVFSKVI